MKKENAQLTFAQIKAKYPNKWVGLADADMEGFVVKKAYLLCVGKDKRKVSKRLNELMDSTPYERYRLEWTGETVERDFMISIVSLV
jgi:hypothetical protein